MKHKDGLRKEVIEEMESLPEEQLRDVLRFIESLRRTPRSHEENTNATHRLARLRDGRRRPGQRRRGRERRGRSSLRPAPTGGDGPQRPRASGPTPARPRGPETSPSAALMGTAALPHRDAGALKGKGTGVLSAHRLPG